MAPDDKGNRWKSIPVNFLDGNGEDSEPGPDEVQSFEEADATSEAGAPDPAHETFDENDPPVRPTSQADGSPGDVSANAGGPEVAELVATRAELKRLEGEVKDLRDSLARRQADFENYRKRMEREGY